MRQKIKITSDENKEHNNGKELVDNHHLFWYNYGARYGVYPECFNGNPQLGHRHAMDPADEFNSPYLYVGNNPINLIDPDGAQVAGGDNGNENFSWQDWVLDNLINIIPGFSEDQIVDNFQSQDGKSPSHSEIVGMKNSIITTSANTLIYGNGAIVGGYIIGVGGYFAASYIGKAVSPFIANELSLLSFTPQVINGLSASGAASSYALWTAGLSKGAILGPPILLGAANIIRYPHTIYHRYYFGTQAEKFILNTGKAFGNAAYKNPNLPVISNWQHAAAWVLGTWTYDLFLD
jgi:hypothetical protein